MSGFFTRVHAALLTLSVSVVFLFPSMSRAKTFYYTFEDTPPTASNDLHLVFDIVDPPPFSFGAPVSTDNGPYTTFSSTTPDIGTGTFSIDYSGGPPSTDPVKVKFHFSADSDVVGVTGNWTLNTNFSGEVNLDGLTLEEVPEPATFVLAALGLAGLAFVGWNRKSRF